MKCPTCKRVAEGDSSQCARCGTDLTLLNDLEQRKAVQVMLGNKALTVQDFEKAQKYFEGVLKIQGTCQDALRGLALVALFRKDFVTAVKMQQLYSIL